MAVARVWMLSTYLHTDTGTPYAVKPEHPCGGPWAVKWQCSFAAQERYGAVPGEVQVFWFRFSTFPAPARIIGVRVPETYVDAALK